MISPTTTLNNGIDMPVLGLGVWRASDTEAEQSIETAVDNGYRAVDTAKLYENEAGVGRAVANSSLPRESLFITTKVWNDDHGYDATLKAFDRSLSLLNMDYVDLYLIHWPCARQDRYVETFRALERLYRDEQVRAIGVSNFEIPHLERLAAETNIVPAINQIELHPYLQQSRLREFHAAKGIHTQAWRPLAQGGELLQDPSLAAIAQRHGKTVAQVILRWHVQLGNIVIPKSVTPQRIADNIDVFDFVLDDAEMATVNGLDAGHRLGNHPDQVG